MLKIKKKFENVKICENLHTPQSVHSKLPTSQNRKYLPATPQSPTFPHNYPHPETLIFPKKSNDLVLNTPKLNNFNNLIV